MSKIYYHRNEDDWNQVNLLLAMGIPIEWKYDEDDEYWDPWEVDYLKRDKCWDHRYRVAPVIQSPQPPGDSTD